MAISTFFWIVVVVVEEFCLFREVTNEDFLSIFKKSSTPVSSSLAHVTCHCGVMGEEKSQEPVDMFIYAQNKQKKNGVSMK